MPQSETLGDAASAILAAASSAIRGRKPGEADYIAARAAVAGLDRLLHEIALLNEALERRSVTAADHDIDHIPPPPKPRPRPAPKVEAAPSA
jgi:hypothetical protein